MLKDRVFSLKDFYFNLPDELVAQYPIKNKAQSRLFVLNRIENEYQHRIFHEIVNYLYEGDVLVVNDAKVIPARIFFNRKTGALIEIVLTQRLLKNRWLVISNRTKKLKKDETLKSTIDPSIEIFILGRIDDYLLIESNKEFSEKSANVKV